MLTAQGEFYEAESLLSDCLQVCQERGELFVSSYAHWALSVPRLVSGRAQEALSNAQESLRIKRHFHDTLGTLIALETMARIYTALDEPGIAATLLGALQQNWMSAGLPQLGAPFLSVDHEKCVKECQRALGDDGYRRAFDSGKRFDLDEASALALGELDASS
ncbi:tetratricopeptide (TPR) repeat protein [Nonomuraea soli]|uniref:Tetratricopeptide (TPR) repeat protein n=1 Tax=Nonomuraea soli TaxID=1032476 RepID=A0A7W0CSI6_9ACTN|nr:hypothetical protein [Nonomuraea soli]MBA2896506.1 tetratricopeptide (TPR) repeat protein [Nonomuraea soli]